MEEKQKLENNMEELQQHYRRKNRGKQQRGRDNNWQTRGEKKVGGDPMETEV